MLEWDFAGAEHSFLRAIELNPGNGDAHQLYAWLLVTLGRFEEGIEQMRLSRSIAPMVAFPSAHLGVMYHFAGDDDRAIPQLEQTIELFPDNPEAYQPLGMILCEHGEFERGIELLEKVRELGGDQAAQLAPLVYAHALAGRLDEARVLFGEMEERSRTEFVDPWSFAIAHVALDEHDEAIAQLERAYELRWVTLPGAGVYPPFAPLRSDPRFQDLLRRIGFPES